MSLAPRNFKDSMRFMLGHRYEPEGFMPLSKFAWFVALVTGATIILVSWFFGAYAIMQSLQDVVVDENDIVRSNMQLSHTDIRSALGAFAVRQVQYERLKEAELSVSSPR